MTAFFAQMDQPQTFTDDDREQAIVRAGNAMKAAFARYEGSSNFADLGDAHRARMSMESLIRGRSAAQVTLMEQSRGLPVRDYGKVSPQFWVGKTGKRLRGDMEAQIVALYLMTSPRTNGKTASQIGAETVARRTREEGRNPGTLHGLSRRADLAIPLHAAHNLGKKESTPDAMARRTKLMRSAI